MKNWPPGLILISACLLLISACAPVVKNDQPQHTGWITLDSEHSLGQTFTARYAGLEGIAFLIEHDTPSDARLELNLFLNEDRTTQINSAVLTLSPSTVPGFERFLLGNTALSNGQDYYARLTMQGEGSVRVAAGPGASYLNGAAYFDDVAQDQQTGFRLVYSPSQAARGLFMEGLMWVFNLSLGFLIFVVPGWGILTTIFPGWRDLYWVEKIGLAAGVSLAIYPILLLWTNVIGLHLGVFYVWLPIIAGIGLMFWKFANRPHALNNLRKVSIADIFCNLAYFAVLTILLFTRLWPMRGLDAPLWGDSLQHTIISQLIVDHNGLFTNWAPYAEMTSFSYHFGFHSLVAALSWMTGMEMSQAVLWTGQILNLLSLLVLVPLANRLSGSRWGGLIALTAAGLLASVPQVYINWGRYTQMTGQIILLVFMYLAWVYYQDHPENRLLAGLSALMLAGLGLAHSRIVLFGLAFLLVYLLTHFRFPGFWRAFRPILITGLGSLLLYLPWLLRILPSTITQLLVAQVTTPTSQSVAAAIQDPTILQYAGLIPGYLWWLSGAALLLALWKRDKTLWGFVAWWLVVLLIGYPQWLGLPGSGIVGGFTVMIAAYIPVSVLVGYLIGHGIHALLHRVSPPRLNLAIAGGFSILVVFVALAGVRPRLADVRVAESSLFTRPDQRAAAWMSANLPSDSLILVNSFLAYDNTVAVGSDGGWWLPFKARRAVTVPPINYSLETGPDPNFRQRVNEITSAILEKGINDPEVLNLLDERGVTHIYLGQQQGSVNYGGPPIQAEQLLAMSSYTPIYHEDRVWIFERNQP